MASETSAKTGNSIPMPVMLPLLIYVILTANGIAKTLLRPYKGSKSRSSGELYYLMEKKRFQSAILGSRKCRKLENLVGRAHVAGHRVNGLTVLVGSAILDRVQRLSGQ